MSRSPQLLLCIQWGVKSFWKCSDSFNTEPRCEADSPGFGAPAPGRTPAWECVSRAQAPRVLSPAAPPAALGRPEAWPRRACAAGALCWPPRGPAALCFRCADGRPPAGHPEDLLHGQQVLVGEDHLCRAPQEHVPAGGRGPRTAVRPCVHPPAVREAGRGLRAAGPCACGSVRVWVLAARGADLPGPVGPPVRQPARDMLSLPSARGRDPGPRPHPWGRPAQL